MRRKLHAARTAVLLTLLALWAFGAPGPAVAVTIDGQLDPEYGPARSVQVNSAYRNDNLRGELDWSDGSELDALHVHVEGGVLYLFLAGNQLSRASASDPGFWADHLHVFLDTRPGGQQTLRADNYAVGMLPGYDVLLHMSGLAFDPGFEADWWLSGFPTGDEHGWTGPFTLHAWRAELPTAGGGPGEYLGSTGAGAGAGLAGGTNPFGIALALDNRNVAGVPGGCATGSGAGVTTGIEWAIPLAAIGDPQDCIRACVLFTYKGGGWMGTQVLPPLPAGTCSYFTPATLDLGAQAGEQWIRICDASTPATRGTWGSLKVRPR